MTQEKEKTTKRLLFGRTPDLAPEDRQRMSLCREYPFLKIPDIVSREDEVKILQQLRKKKAFHVVRINDLILLRIHIHDSRKSVSSLDSSKLMECQNCPPSH